MTVLQRVEVRTTDAACDRLHEDLTGTRCRVRNVGDDQFSVAQHRSSHVCDSSAVTKFMAADDPATVTAAVDVLRAGGVVLIPTDTVYGIASSPAATDRLYALKDRPDTVPIAVLVDSVAQASELVDFSEAATRVAERLWPGPLTIVLSRRDGAGTLGVRCPDHEFVRRLAREAGALAVTSANRHRASTPTTARDAAASLVGEVALVVDGGERAGTASTVVDLTQSRVVILRAGPITQVEIEAAALR